MVENCDLDLTPNTNLIQNGADAVALFQAQASEFPNGSQVTNAHLISALVYDTNDTSFKNFEIVSNQLFLDLKILNPKLNITGT